MIPNWKQYGHDLRQAWILWPIVPVLALGLAVLFFPETSFKAALRGIDAWWNIVFPALLPFFIISNLLMSMGFVYFIGVFLEPLMRPVFRLPGASAFVMAMGFTSGAPIGALLTGQLRRQEALSRQEAERLMAFTNNASPLFILGAVSVGMFHSPQLGFPLLAGHYLANLTVGLLLALFSHRGHGAEISGPVSPPRHILRCAVRAMLQARRQDGRNLGQALRDAVNQSVQTLCLIGGFIAFFAVVIDLASLLGVIDALASAFAYAFKGLGFNTDMARGMAAGAVEMTLGVKTIGAAPGSLLPKLLAVSMVLGWSGFSIHAQVAAVTAQTDLRLKTFIVGRFFQALLAPAYTFILLLFTSLPAVPAVATPWSSTSVWLPANWLWPMQVTLNLFGYTMLVLTALAIIISLGQKIRIAFFFTR